jgi:uncharacterized protein (TIGR04255 family)
MEIGRHYPRAPITEALVDLRVSFREGISLERLRDYGGKVKRAYPHEETREIFEAQFGLQKAPSTSRQVLGYLYRSSDKLQAVQARRDGFTFSRFAPYETWEHLIAESHRLWDIFVETLRPTAVERIAVRYINQLVLPIVAGALDFEHYLQTFPKIGEGPSPDLEQFFIRLQLPQRDIDARLILTEALLPPQVPESVGVILDIDLFREGLAFPPDSGEIWSILNAFRDRKNLYFEASITDRARELFK